jgi:hypothetical protein
MPFKRSWLIAFAVLVIGTTLSVTHAQTRSSEDTVSFLAMGDWGSNGPDQKKVARKLAEYVQSSGRTYQGMLLLGDNCYVKLQGMKGTPEALWNEMFEKTYDPIALNFPFYAALGNHDYSNAAAQFELDYAANNPKSRWKMPAKYYRLDLPEKNPMVTVLMLDSCKDNMGPAAWDEEQKWIQTELAKPRTTKWIIAAAHHPFFSNGDHGDNGVVQSTWGSLFKKAGVDFYVCGHDHDVQHLEVPNWGMSFVLAGGGGARVRPMRVDQRGPFSKSVMGFADIQFTPTTAKCRLVSGEGKVLHEFARSHDRVVNVTFTTPSDVATARTPKSVARPDAEDAPTTKPATVVQ